MTIDVAQDPIESDFRFMGQKILLQSTGDIRKDERCAASLNRFLSDKMDEMGLYPPYIKTETETPQKV